VLVCWCIDCDMASAAAWWLIRCCCRKSVVRPNGEDVVRSFSILFLRVPSDRDERERGRRDRNAGEVLAGCCCGG